MLSGRQTETFSSSGVDFADARVDEVAGYWFRGMAVMSESGRGGMI